MQKIRILVPVSFSLQSDLALKQAKIFASQLNVMLTCLYVIEYPGIVTGRILSGELEKKIKREAELKLSSKVNEIFSDHEGIPFELIVSTGKVYRKILEKASELRMDLIIMGNSDSGAKARHDIGSNACRVVARSSIPVITTNVHNVKIVEHIVLPLDLSDRINIKISKSMEIAHLFHARVTVCSFIGFEALARRASIDMRLGHIQRIFNHSGIECNVQIIEVEKTVPDEIISFTRDLGADLIFLMTQQESNITDMFIGSTAREVIRKSIQPVMSISPNIYLNYDSDEALFREISEPIIHI